MKRYGHLWDRFIAWDNLLLAARKARRGKRKRPVVRRFEFTRELHLLRLQRELQDGTYRPGAFHTHRISHPKPRLISAAPYRDRVVHHALLNVLEPILDRHFHPDSYACRKGKGTHAASDRLQALMRRCRYALVCDVQKFFPSIDHEILKGLFRRRIKDARLLWLMDLIVDHSNEQEPVQHFFPGDDLFTAVDRRKGLPIGNLTSQWFANWYLDQLDQVATHRWRVGGYVRYCDDFVLLDGSQERLLALKGEVRGLLAARRLRPHERKLQVVPVRSGLKFVGYRTWAKRRVVPKDKVRRFRRRLGWMEQAHARGRITGGELRRGMTGWWGHVRRTNSEWPAERWVHL